MQYIVTGGGGFIGSNLVEKLRLENPGYADSWYKNKMRNIRKQRTVDYFNNKYSLGLDDFDVADSMGIAYYANEVLTKR
mgnify:CR=1 FL=1